MKWYEAEHYCKKEGGKLVEIDSAVENTALVDEINERGYTEKEMHFWIGLTDLASEGDWRLASNGLRPSFQNWIVGQPNNNKEEQHCARIKMKPNEHFDSDRNKWSDIKCWENHYALCEFGLPNECPSIQEPTTENTPTTGTSTKSQHAQRI